MDGERRANRAVTKLRKKTLRLEALKKFENPCQNILFCSDLQFCPINAKFLGSGAAKTFGD